MSEADKIIITKIKQVGTLEQINLFGQLSEHSRNMEMLNILDGYARLRAFQFLSPELRTMENLFKLPKFDRWVAFGFLLQEFRTMENLKRLQEEDQWRAFQFLLASERTFVNLKMLPKKFWHCAFQFLNESEKNFQTWQKFSQNDREKSFCFLPHRFSSGYNNMKANSKKIAASAICIALAALIFFSAVVLIGLYFLFPLLAVIINSLVVTVGLTASAAMICTTTISAVLAIASVIAGGFAIAKCASAVKTQALLKSEFINEFIEDHQQKKESLLAKANPSNEKNSPACEMNQEILLE